MSEVKTAPTDLFFLSDLDALLDQREKARPKGSYTTSLFEEGLDRMAQKVGEEAVETVIAAKNKDDPEFLGEAADLIFHLMVLLKGKGFGLADVVAILKQRHAKK